MGIHSDKSCRICGEKEETQEHILEECIDIMENEHEKITTQEIFESNTEKLRITASKIKEKNQQIQ
jgi:uncharacterized membrane-anchored protein